MMTNKDLLKKLYVALDCAADALEAHPELWTKRDVGVSMLRSMSAEKTANFAPDDPNCKSCVMGMAIRCGLPAEYYENPPGGRGIGTYESIQHSIYMFNDMQDTPDSVVKAIRKRTYPFGFMRKFDVEEES